jgi:hypothetical protein
VHLLYVVGIAGAVILASLVSLAAWQEIDDGGFYRIVGALAVAELLVILLQPILRRTGGRPATSSGVPVFEFSVTLADGREVPGDRPARDFATAVASAISEVERSGGRVVRVERR